MARAWSAVINDARNCIRLACAFTRMYRWGWNEGLKYGALVGVITGAVIPTVVYFLIAR
jgi:hypothetical protein